MSQMVSLSHHRKGEATFAILKLERAERANSLVPELVDDLNNHLASLETEEIDGVVIRSAGSFFSSGGDVAGFARYSGTELVDYADHLVGGLQYAVLRLFALPAPVIARLQGGVTGGAAGLIFVADLVAMDEKAFIQPYYSEVGFAPDGGWTALLRTRVPIACAFSIQALNRRIQAEEARALGLADQIAPVEALDDVVDAWLNTLAEKSAESLRTTKRLLRSDEDIARLRQALDAERREFLRLVALPDTARRMERFLQ